MFKALIGRAIRHIPGTTPAFEQCTNGIKL